MALSLCATSVSLIPRPAWYRRWSRCIHVRRGGMQERHWTSARGIHSRSPTSRCVWRLGGSEPRMPQPWMLLIGLASAAFGRRSRLWATSSHSNSSSSSFSA